MKTRRFILYCGDILVHPDVEAADTFLTRLKGLMFDKSSGRSIWLNPCSSVHTFMMRYPIDVVYLDSESIIVSIDARLAPGRLSRGGKDAVSCVELPSGMAEKCGLAQGMTLRFETKGDMKYM